MLEPGYEPIHGYRLKSRLGAGGYGEVWLCDAPGGLQKAIKFIFGAVTGPQATKELRSLERISKVNHPFLLSIERIEVVGDQLLIVTELAEHSLEDQLKSCRKDGRSGLPRRDLLQYMRDAAEALDFLATEHSLQHLDIKPANLLVLSKRIKVADFGLLKDLQAVQQSCIGGMTPAYTAPEVFDGCPDFRSDQYSLAITYIELLTGGLPFSGATLAALAKQHLNEAPNLDMLPPGDRNIVARAMLKHPMDRYANCRQFIDQLMNVKATMMPIRSESAATTSGLKVTTTTAVTSEQCNQFEPTISTGDERRIEAESPPPTLTIGLGGLGGSALSDLRQRQLGSPNAHFLYIDTDASEIKRHTTALDEDDSRRLPLEDVIHLRLEKPEAYRSSAPERFQSISRRWLYNVPRSGLTEGIRPLALLSLLHHQESVAWRLRQSLQQLGSAAEGKPVRVQILCSLHGATGSGTLAALGFMIREIGESAGIAVETEGLVTIAESAYSGPAKMAPAAALVTLAELDAYFDTDTLPPPLFDATTGSGQVARTASPLQRVIASHGGCLGDVTDVHRAAQSLADLAEFRFYYPGWQVAANGTAGWFTSAQRLKLELPFQHSSTSLGVFCVLRGLALFRDSLTGKRQGGPASAANVAEELQRRLEHAIGLHADSANHLEAMLQYVELKSKVEQDGEASAQLADDAMGRIHSVVYNTLMSNHASWSQAQKALDNTAATLAGLAATPARALECLRELPEYADEARFEAACDEAARRFGVVARAIREHCDVFRNMGSDYAGRVSECGNQIASKIPADHGRDLAASVQESKPLRDLVAIVAEHLQSVLTRTLPISAAVGASESMQRSVQPLREFNVAQLITEAVAQIKKLSARYEITFNDSDEQAYSQASKIVEKLDLAIPPLARCGGQVTRQVAGRAKEIGKLKALLKRGGGEHVINHTSFAHWEHPMCAKANWILSTAGDLPLELLIRNLWRPAADTLKLAEKLRSRVDVRWPSIDELLTRSPQGQSSTNADSTDAKEPVVSTGGADGPNQAGVPVAPQASMEAASVSAV